MSELQRHELKTHGGSGLPFMQNDDDGRFVDADEANALISELRARIAELESNAEPMRMFHKLWTMCVGTPGYNKAVWSDIENQILAVIWRKEETTALNSVAAGAARAYIRAQAGEVVKRDGDENTQRPHAMYGVGRKISEVKTERLTVQSLIDLLKLHEPTALVRFSIADDDSPDEGERWFAEEGIESCFGDKLEVTICLVARSNMKD